MKKSFVAVALIIAGVTGTAFATTVAPQELVTAKKGPVVIAPQKEESQKVADHVYNNSLPTKISPSTKGTPVKVADHVYNNSLPIKLSPTSKGTVKVADHVYNNLIPVKITPTTTSKVA